MKILSHTNIIPPKIDVSYSRYPMSKDRLMGDADIMADIGGFYFLLIPLVIFVIIFLEIAREKELKLR